MSLIFRCVAGKAAVTVAAIVAPICLLSSEAIAATIDFTQPQDQSPLILSSFSKDGVTVTGSHELYIGFSEAVDSFDPDFPFVVTETNGIGIVGGDVSEAFFPEVSFDSDAFVDSGESVLFSFDRPAEAVSFSLLPGSTIDLDGVFSDPGTVEAFGIGGGSLGKTAVNDTVFNVSNAFHNQILSSFQFTAAADIGTSISSVSFESAEAVPDPSALLGLGLLGISAFWTKKRTHSS